MTRMLMEGSEAIAEAAIAAGCRFFAGYPMTPFTELLEHFAKKLPAAGGVCINAESEIEAPPSTLGAADGAFLGGIGRHRFGRRERMVILLNLAQVVAFDLVSGADLQEPA